MVVTQERNSDAGDANPFKKAGIALIVIGILDIGSMIYSVVNRLNYSSSLNIFAVIAGILLLKRGIKTARAVRWLSVLMFTAFVGIILFTPVFTPIALVLTQLESNPLKTIGASLISMAFIGLSVWVYLQLSTPASLEMLKQAGYNVGKPTSAYFAGAALVVVLSGLTCSIKNSEYGDRAKSLAREQLGSDFKYAITSISISGNSGQAVVTAYNKQEIKVIEVAW